MGKDEGGKGGVLVNMSSIGGLAPVAGCPIYVATKHAVIGLTRSFGVSTAYTNVNIL
jgi:15-hydroxyprostaglandin dehydrogenase (NAD)